MSALGIACICVLIVSVALSQRTRASGIAHSGSVVTSRETTAAIARVSRVPRIPTSHTGPASGPAAGAIPSDQQLGPEANVPAISKLDPALRQALQAADAAMRNDGIHLWITSGWRTDAYQQRLYEEAIATHGIDYARTHVATADKTEHTKGAAADIAPTAADYWLIRNGAQYGLCQTYANEIWHFEFTATGGKCPAMRTDALG